MGHKWTKLSVHQKTKEELMNDCKNIFLKDNPKLSDINITENFMLKKVIDFYKEN